MIVDKEILLDKVLHIREDLRKKSLFIHVLTNSITMNDTANLLLAAHVHPIMAQHSLEIREIVSKVDALAINLGNITPYRLEAMQRAGQVLVKKNLPSLIDVVGAGVSLLRSAFAKNWIDDYHPLVVKGNISEISALVDLSYNARGVEAAQEDILFLEAHEEEVLLRVASYAKKWRTIFLITGRRDFIVSPQGAYIIENGSEKMSFLTGTGCMLGALVASYLSFADPLLSALTATLEWGIVGELAEERATTRDGFLGLGTYHREIFDVFSTLPIRAHKSKEIFARAKIEYRAFSS